MTSTHLEAGLIQAMAEFEIIDSHEHLGPEKSRTDTPADLFTLFSQCYSRNDLALAGMGEADSVSVFDPRIPLDRRWEIFQPYWEQIRWGSYARAALIAVRRFYGFDDINQNTYAPLSEAVRRANQPGIYERVLRDACNIRVVLTQCGSTDLGSPLLVPLMPLEYQLESQGGWEDVVHPPFFPEACVRTLDDYVDALRCYVLRVKAEGAVGLKTKSRPNEEPCREEAIQAFNRLRDGTATHLPERNPMTDYVTDQIICFATELDLVIAVHTGYWGDFRKLDPLHIIPILQRHPKARFDIYHLGYPWVRPALMLGKGFPNVWLNLCWTHIISQRCVVAALDEAIDLVPMNKILAFGGDYALPVEKVYGHLVMARENIACVLARRIERRQMTEGQAVDLARTWFWDNPKELYRLDL